MREFQELRLFTWRKIVLIFHIPISFRYKTVTFSIITKFSSGNILVKLSRLRFVPLTQYDKNNIQPATT